MKERKSVEVRIAPKNLENKADIKRKEKGKQFGMKRENKTEMNTNSSEEGRSTKMQAKSGIGKNNVYKILITC